MLGTPHRYFYFVVYIVNVDSKNVKVILEEVNKHNHMSKSPEISFCRCLMINCSENKFENLFNISVLIV